MKRVVDHVQRHIGYIHEKPHHIRKQVAFGSAAGITFLIGLVWFAYSAQTGVFAIQGSSFADAAKDSNDIYAEAYAGTDGLAGAAAAVPADPNAPRLNVVDKTPPKPIELEQTTIPF